MAAYPSCIRAIPHDTNKGHDSPSIRMCLYMHTAGHGITDKLRKEAGEMFSDYNYDFVDLEIEPLGEYFTPRDRNDQLKSEKMAKLAQIIEKNLPLFENRLNVTAVYPSYKISEGQETDDLCITVSVLGKGLTPVGENEFSKTLDGHPLDIVEGYFSQTNGPFLSQASPLHLGVGIGVRGKRGAGTLGAFLTDEFNHLYVLSCQHVLSKKNEKPAEEQPSRKQTAEEQTTEKNYMDGVKRLENFISERMEELKKPDESGKIDKKEIKAFESAAKIPGEEELIEQPAAEDFITEMYEWEKNIREKNSELNYLKKKHSESPEKKAIKSNIIKQEEHLAAFKSELTDLTKFRLPKWIATYSCGLQENYRKPDDKKCFFVDAAIAKINPNERDVILSRIQESDPVYGYDTRFSYEKQKKIYEKGEIVPVSKIVKGPETFWKAGRTTCITEGGKFHSEHFFVRVKSRQKDSPDSTRTESSQSESSQDFFGEFTHAKFQTYCKTCRPKTSGLLETSLLKEVKCYKCGETLPANSESREFWAYNCFLVYLSRDKPFSTGGDSGAVIFDEDGRAWGIIVGNFVRDRTYTVAISLDIALEALKDISGKELKLLCVNPSLTEMLVHTRIYHI